jgi:hypothetical protein
MLADLPEVTVKGCALLLSVDGVSTGIDIDDDEPLFVPAPKEGVGRSAEHIFEGFQTLTGCEDVVLKARECGLADPAVVLFSQGQTQCRVYSQVIGLIAVLIACRYLVDSLAQQLE